MAAEYYNNSSGLSESEFGDVLDFIRNGLDSNDPAVVTQTRLDFTSRFQKRTFMRDYLYIKLTQPELFGWLYFSIGAFTVYNLNDNSFTFSTQLIYKPFTNFEFLFWPTLFFGNANSEYGSKQFERKAEVWLRFFL